MRNSKCTVLIVEDEFIIAMSLQEKLKSQGYNVPVIASSGEAAVKFFNEYNPQIILMDVVLDGSMDGIDASMQIRKKSRVPILFCSAYSDEQTMERMKNVSISDFILKPISEHELEEKLQSFINSTPV